MQTNLTRAQISGIASLEILRWADRQPNGHAAGIALLRLDDMLGELDCGKSLGQALRDNFNDRLLTRLEIALS
jgi:hypothetical protein